MIKPTIGRVVIIQRGSHDAQPDGWPAFVNKVHSDRCINVAGYNEWGTTVSFNSITLLQDEDAPPAAGPYAEWMPYQKGQAAKAEAQPQTPAPSADQTYEAVCASWHAAQSIPRRMPWKVAVEILSVVKKLPAEEREKLLALDDDKATATA